MKTTKTAKAILKSGKTLEIKLTIDRSVLTENIDLDGYVSKNVKKTNIEKINLELSIDGNVVAKGSQRPTRTPDFMLNDQQKSAGIVSFVNRSGIGESAFDAIEKLFEEAYAELDASPENKEYKEVQNEKLAKEQKAKDNIIANKKIREERIANGWCPKCESYCYGDCTAN